MKFGPVPLEYAEGKILGHNVAGREGRRLLHKGKPLTNGDIVLLRELGRRVVYVAELEPGDVAEDTAARRVAQAAQGKGVRLLGSATGRVNLLATALGLFRVDRDRLARLNECEGITLAALSSHTTVRPGQVVATVKIIPYGVPRTAVSRAEAVAAEGGPLTRVDALKSRFVGMILFGSPSVRNRLFEEFSPLRERVEALGAKVNTHDYVTLEDEAGESALVNALQRQRDAGVRLILLAGETAIMDRHDIMPRAIEQAGGRVECVGAPVDPGNLLMLAYLGDVAVLGAPGCARSRKTNVVDWVLPRLLAGDTLRRSDIIALGHGGLLEEVPERPLPRSQID
ncbi:MAG: molybdopterin-binding protein [Acidobacteriota bacterium]